MSRGLRSNLVLGIILGLLLFSMLAISSCWIFRPQPEPETTPRIPAAAQSAGQEPGPANSQRRALADWPPPALPGADQADPASLVDPEEADYAARLRNPVLPQVPGSAAVPEPATLAAQPQTDKGGARLVIVMDDLGESVRLAEEILALPYPVTFSIWPESSRAAQVAEAAHAAGREVIIHQPMEPLDYPLTRPGPGALLLSASQARLIGTLNRNLAKVPHAIGLNNHMGSRFTQDAAALRPLIPILRGRGLLVLDSVTHPDSLLYSQARAGGLNALRRDIFLDVAADKAAILAQLARAERIALKRGQAIAIGHPLPETLEALREWEKIRNRAVNIVRLQDLI